MSKNINPKNNNPKENQRPSTPKTESNTGRGNSLEKGSGQFGKGMTVSPQKPKKKG